MQSGDAFIEKGEYLKAAKAYQQSIKLKPSAEACLESSNQSQTDFGFAHIVLGQYYWDLGKKTMLCAHARRCSASIKTLAAELNLYINTRKK